MADSVHNTGPCRHLILVLGDQLSLEHPAFAGFDPRQDRVLMIEAASEATEVWSHQARIVLFLSAMRHFIEAIKQRGWPSTYLNLDDDALASDLGSRLGWALAHHRPQSLWVMKPGEWRLLDAIESSALTAQVPLKWFEDNHFLCSPSDFEQWAQGRKTLRMAHFYSHMRITHQVLMEPGQPKQPVMGRWSFDAENRKGFGKLGPGWVAQPLRFAPDAITQAVIRLVRQRFSDHPGQLDEFDWPVTRADALKALQSFVDQRLQQFGPWQDAMWTGLPYGWHALLSSSLNLHLINPREVIDAALAAWREQNLPIESVEGFVRQILGWREFVRGVYGLDMPMLAQANHFNHQRNLPVWYWTGQTHMRCMHMVIQQTLRHGYAHHIQRLMVTGQFALLAQLQPQQVSAWYRAMYVDALEWVEMPNTLGMALYATGGRMTSKPYVASGMYIQRMSNYCDGCRYRPSAKTGPQACPMSTLYWHFLITHQARFQANPRTRLMVTHLKPMSEADQNAIVETAQQLLNNLEAI